MINDFIMLILNLYNKRLFILELELTELKQFIVEKMQDWLSHEVGQLHHHQGGN